MLNTCVKRRRLFSWWINNWLGVTRPMANTPKSPRPAVFLDRDGALIEEAHYLSKVEQVRLLPGVVDGLRLLERAGFVLVVATPGTRSV